MASDITSVSVDELLDQLRKLGPPDDELESKPDRERYDTVVDEVQRRLDGGARTIPFRDTPKPTPFLDDFLIEYRLWTGTNAEEIIAWAQSRIERPTLLTINDARGHAHLQIANGLVSDNVPRGNFIVRCGHQFVSCTPTHLRDVLHGLGVIPSMEVVSEIINPQPARVG